MGGEIRDTGIKEPSTKSPRLFYHGIGEPTDNTAPLLEEYGLLGEANVPTLSPILEVVSQYIDLGNIAITFWYPERDGTSKQAIRNYAAPTTPLPLDVKQRALESVKSSDFPAEDKTKILEHIKKATAYIPPSNLGAIAKMRMADLMNLADALPHDSRILVDYTTDKDALKQYLVEYLDTLDIKYVDPNLNSDQLADDMIQTTLEHFMLSLGSGLKDAGAVGDNFSLERKLRELQEPIKELDQIRFQEPKYEKYRRLLLLKYSRLASKTAGLTSARLHMDEPDDSNH